MTIRRLTTSERLLGAAIFIGYVMALVWTAPDLAMSRDESFYAQAAGDYGAWMQGFASDPTAMIDQEQIDQAWRYNWEHPALMKVAFAWSALLHDKLDLFSSESLAFRFPGMLLAGLLLWLVYAWGAVTLGWRGALFAALALGLLPRVFYHSHLAAFDVPIAFFITLSAYTYWRTLEDRRWAPLAGAAFGLALATKHNSWMLPAIFAIHYGWVRWQYARAGREEKPTSAWLPWMLTLGPLTLVATWPWVWHDTWSRLWAYARFHLQHVHYTYEYLGVSYFEPPLPVSVPFVMTLFTVPLVVLVLSVFGFVARRTSFTPPWRTRPGDAVDTRPEVLWLGCFLAALIAIALPNSPIFGGTKHWLSAYPFLVLFAGWGLLGVSKVSFAARPKPTLALGALCLLPGLVETAHSHPFGLSHYTAIAGGVPGAADLGMNRQFWGFTTGSVADWLAEELPQGGTVWPGDTTRGSWRMMQLDDKLPDNIKLARSIAEADLVLVHHEAHFREVDYQAWVAFENVQPAHVLTYDGVPIISVYRRPDR